jgi:predicted house-cleaning noncanonical NTP pyrophosphatase (MazG superfamily)
MGWKLVRDNNEAACRERGISGQWRISPDPPGALAGKVLEEFREYAFEQPGHRDPAELYDLLDVVQALIGLEDPLGEFAALHRAKVEEMGGFTKFIEWCPVPGAADDGTAG